MPCALFSISFELQPCSYFRVQIIVCQTLGERVDKCAAKMKTQIATDQKSSRKGRCLFDADSELEGSKRILKEINFWPT